MELDNKGSITYTIPKEGLVPNPDDWYVDGEHRVLRTRMTSRKRMRHQFITSSERAALVLPKEPRIQTEPEQIVAVMSLVRGNQISNSRMDAVSLIRKNKAYILKATSFFTNRY